MFVPEAFHSFRRPCTFDNFVNSGHAHSWSFILLLFYFQRSQAVDYFKELYNFLQHILLKTIARIFLSSFYKWLCYYEN